MTALPEGHQLGPYRIVRLLGEGGMGAVYEARQEPLDRRVALKTLHPEYAGNKDAVARFFNEGKVLSRLEHPSIVQVVDFGNAADDGVDFGAKADESVRCGGGADVALFSENTRYDTFSGQTAGR